MSGIAGVGSPSRFPDAPSRYRIEAFRGGGGAGTVYRAWDRELGRRVALKFLRDDRLEHGVRMMREARAQARIDHPNVCRVYDVGEEGGRPYIAMQWVEGETLDTFDPKLSVEQKVAIIRDVATAVHAAHVQQVIHRDLKPSNILIERREDGVLHPVVVDFGLARAVDDPGMTATGEILGTPQYIAPEQAWGQSADRRSDVYSLGATLHQLLAGHPPYPGDSAADVMMQVLAGPPLSIRRTAPSLPRDLATIVDTCLRREPELRYDSARGLADDLERWLRAEPIQAKPPGFIERTVSFFRRHRTIAASITLTTLLVGGLSGWWVRGLRLERREAEITDQLEERVRYVERYLAHERSLPLHDTRPAAARVAREISLLVSDSAWARYERPRDYAEGRARLASGDVESAVVALQRAWDGGLRTPAVAYHLGVALSKTFGRALSHAERIGDDALREARQRELRERLRSTALPVLQRARGYAEEPASLIEARIAAAEGDSERTVALAGEVIERFPWNNDARILQAELLLDASGRHRASGRLREALAALERAHGVYEDARRIAPSDVRLLDGLCRCAERRLHLTADGGGDHHADFTTAKSECEQALAAQPDHVSSLVTLSSAWTRYAFFLGQHGGDDAAARGHAIEAAEAALRIAPDDPAALLQAGAAYYWMPLEQTPRAVAYLRRAAELDPGSVEARHGLGRAMLRLHDHLRVNGHAELRPVIEEAIATYRDVIRRAPQYLQAYSNLAYALNHLADYEENSGRDPESHYREMVRVLSPELLAAHPEASGLRLTASIGWHRLARQRIARGEDASVEIERGLAATNEAVRINPSLGTFQARAQIRLIEAHAASDLENRRRALDAVDADLRRIETLTGGNEEYWVRLEWYLARAQLRVEPETALRDLDHAARLIDAGVLGADNRWLVAIYRGRVAGTRCRIAPSLCRGDEAEQHFREALALTRWTGADVERARAELARMDGRK